MAGSSSHASRLPREGDLLGDYQLERLLGRGGMGAVFVARHRSLGVAYALKVQHLEGSARAADRAARFQREAEALARVDRHPHVVGIHHFATLPDRPEVAYCVLDLVEGEDLDRLLARGGPPPSGQALRWCEQLARALAHVHARGVVHRDLKPANVLIRAEDQAAVLTDFGLARGHGESDLQRLTASGQMVGTLTYMAPEQLRGEHAAIGPRTDVFALGALLFELISGECPYQGDHPAQVAMNIIQGEAPSLAELRPDLPRVRDLEELFRATQAQEPDQRPSAAEVADALAGLARGEGWSESRGLRRELAARLRRRPGLVALAALAVAGGAGGLGWWLGVARPRAAAEGALAAERAWAEEYVAPLALGLVEVAAPPASAELEAHAAALAPLAPRLGAAEAERARALAAELRALARARRGEAPGAPQDDPSRVLAALARARAGERSDARRLLNEVTDPGYAPARLLRAELDALARPEAGLLKLAGVKREPDRAHARQLAGRVLRAACLAGADPARPAPPSPALLEACVALGVDAAAARRARLEALEARATDWDAALARVPGAQGEQELLAALRALAGSAWDEDGGRAPRAPRLQAALGALIERHAAEASATSDLHGAAALGALQRALACEDAAHAILGLGYRHAGFARLLEAPWVHAAPPSLLSVLAFLRYDSIHRVGDMSTVLSPADLEVARAKRAREPAARALLLLIAGQHAKTQPAREEAADRMLAFCEDPTSADLARRFRGRLYADAADLLLLGRRRQTPKHDALARRALAAAARCRELLEAERAEHSLEHFCSSYEVDALAYQLLGDAPALPRLWGEAARTIEAKARAFPDGPERQHLLHYQSSCLLNQARALVAAAKGEGGSPAAPEAERLLRAAVAVHEGSGVKRGTQFSAALALAQLLLAQGREADALAALDLVLPDGLKDLELARLAVQLELRRRNPERARRLLETARDFHPPNELADLREALPAR
ncbi:MAG: protein kinase [Planctomycetota bacterium]